MSDLRGEVTPVEDMERSIPSGEEIIDETWRVIVDTTRREKWKEKDKEKTKDKKMVFNY